MSNHVLGRRPKNRLLAILAFAMVLPRFCVGATQMVTTPADTGAGSLRAAVAAAATGDTIAFAIPANNTPPFPLPAYATVFLTSAPITLATNGITIDGTTQTAGGAVEINGVGLPVNTSGIVITATGCTIKGLVINRCPNHGIDIQGGTNTIIGNKIGTNFFGNGDLNNGANSTYTNGSYIVGGDGIHITSAGNIIGGTAAAASNIVSGNVSAGIELTGAACTGNTVQGNICGLNANGSGAIGNFDGILVTTGANGNTIGGTAAGAGNTCSGNAHDGIHLVSVNNTVVQGNFVGTDATGTKIITSASVFGIEISGCMGTLVGGTVAGARNVVGGNAAGIELDAGSTNNTVQGNYAGLGADGKAAVGNRLHGIVLRDNGVQNNMIGGTAAGAGNTAAFNGTGGIAVFNLPADPMQSTGNAILGNSVYQNGRSNPTFLLGIDLVSMTSFPKDDGVTPNHNPVSTTGPNNFQNFPVLTSAIPAAAGGTMITGTLFAKAGTAFRVEFFGNPADPLNGVAEGQNFLGFATVTTDANGNASFSATVAGSATAGQTVTATATDPANNTSEFSAAVAVAAPPAFTSTLTANGTVGTAFTYSITASGATPIAFTANPLPAGLTLSGATIAGTPTGVGVFNINLGATNVSGAAPAAKLVLTVMAPSGTSVSNSLTDSDGDGFPDELESFLKTDPLSAASTPFGGAAAGTPVALASPKLAIKLNFAKPTLNDSITLSASFAVASGVAPSGKTLTVDVGGVLATFTLDPRGSGTSGAFDAKVAIKGTTAKLTFTGKKGTFAASLSDEGFTTADTGKTPKSLTVPVIVLFNNTFIQANVAQSYSAKAGKGGSSKINGNFGTIGGRN